MVVCSFTWRRMCVVVPVDLLAGGRRLTEVARTVMEGSVARRVFRWRLAECP